MDRVDLWHAARELSLVGDLTNETIRDDLVDRGRRTQDLCG